MEESFHSRFSAKKKTYTYFFYSGNVEIPTYANIAYCTKCNLDIELMQEACKKYIGEHDFTSFCAANTEVENKVRTIYEAKIYNVYDKIYAFEVTGNGFLYNMVRIMVGTLIDIGRGKKNVEYIDSLYKEKDRTLASKTVPGEYLLLKSVEYKDDIID
ncbi:MAG: tRNA pseudouridine synthase A [Clostridia bacterium]|nr:tRNA pseudouridine synthase A [Clostridia bacterium]